jgi:hypothetical protein
MAKAIDMTWEAMVLLRAKGTEEDTRAYGDHPDSVAVHHAHRQPDPVPTGTGRNRAAVPGCLWLPGCHQHRRTTGVNPTPSGDITVTTDRLTPWSIARSASVARPAR